MPRLLLVQNDNLGRMAIIHYLTLWHWVVEPVDSPYNLPAILKESRPDVVLLDIDNKRLAATDIPALTGGTGLPVVILSGEPENKLRQMVAAGIGIGYFSKGGGLDGLRLSLCRAMGRKPADCRPGGLQAPGPAAAFIKYDSFLPIPTHIDTGDQIELIHKNAFVAECNEAAAALYGHNRPDNLIGEKISDCIIPDRNAVEAVRGFILNGYTVRRARFTDMTAAGPRPFVNDITGVIEDGRLTAAWRFFGPPDDF